MRLAEMFNVNHFIVSQVNPHVVPFLVREEDGITRDAQKGTVKSPSEGTWAQTFAALAKDEALHRMHVLSELGIFPNVMTKMRSVLSQKYSGDITILPEVPYADFVKVLQNPTTEFMMHSTVSGERATWPKLSRIRNHCAIELALDDAIQQLRARVAFSQSQVDLRSYASKAAPARASSDSGRGRNTRAHRKRQRMKQKGSLDSNDPTRKTNLSIEIPNSNRVRTRQSPQRPLSSGNVVFANRKPSASFHLTPESGAKSAYSALGKDMGWKASLASYSPYDQGEASDADESSDDVTYGHNTNRGYDATTSTTCLPSHLFPHASQPATPRPNPSQTEPSSYFEHSRVLPLRTAAKSSSFLPYRPSWPTESRSPLMPRAVSSRSRSSSPLSSRRSSKTSVAANPVMAEMLDHDDTIGTGFIGNTRRRRRRT